MYLVSQWRYAQSYPRAGSARGNRAQWADGLLAPATLTWCSKCAHGNTTASRRWCRQASWSWSRCLESSDFGNRCKKPKHWHTFKIPKTKAKRTSNYYQPKTVHIDKFLFPTNLLQLPDVIYNTSGAKIPFSQWNRATQKQSWKLLFQTVYVDQHGN